VPEQTRRAAVLGSPIAHSLSPVLHRAAYTALGLHGWRYDRVECVEAGLDDFIDSLGAEWAGLSLTMPLKRAALAACDAASPLAEAVGAANTLLMDGAAGAWPVPYAENTDVAGIVTALREAGVQRVEHAVVLGAGGTAQATLAALRELGATSPTVLVRDPARAGELQAAADRLGVRPEVRGGLPDLAIPPADLVVSTLPGTAADGPAAVSRWQRGAVLLDVVYDPWPTRLAVAAQAAGATVVSGLPVLLHQAAAQVALMTGRDAPVEAMRAALDEAVALGRRG